MVTKQTVMWTALPNGVRTDKDGTQWLKVSAFMSPRLESDVKPLTLGAFPDFVTDRPGFNWASTAASLRFSATFELRNHTTITVPAASVRKTSIPEPTLWSELFTAQTPVKGYVAPNLSKARVNSYAIKESSAALRDHISAIASQAASVYKIPRPEELLAPAGFVNSPLTEHLAAELNSAGLRAAAAPTQDTIYDRFTAFHAPFIRPVDPLVHEWNRLTPEERAARNAAQRETDFHKAISALGNFPALLTLLGIVVNLEIPLTGSALSAIRSAARIRLVPEWPDAGSSTVKRVNASPWTACEVKGKSTARGYKVTSFRAESKDDELSDGYLIVRDTSETGDNDPVTLTNIDVDLALGRMFTALGSMAHEVVSRVSAQPMSAASVSAIPAVDVEQAAKIEAGLPTLGQPALALAVNGTGQRLTRLLDSADWKNGRLAKGHDSEIVNYAEELTRGYRVDVWDSVTKVWHPLCQRMGTYQLGNTTLTWDNSSGGQDPELIDEAWVQLAVGSSPDGDPQAPEEMRIHEQMFTWNGWSLVVQRPGAALAAEDEQVGDDPTNTMRPNTMKRTYVDPEGTTRDLGDFENQNLPLTTRFRVPPGTLPRLRLGTTYCFRARAVDLAGNSVPFSAGTPTDTPGGANDTLTTVTREIVHKRYEPIRPPTVVITEELRANESPYHLVVTSNYNSSPTQTTSRHICPPRTSFTMSEVHGAFDKTTPGHPMAAEAWEEIADRDAWDFPQNDLPPDDPAHGQQLPVSSIEEPLPYLADVPSRGASFTGLPGQKKKTGDVTYTGRQPLLGSTIVKLGDDSEVSSEALRVPFERDIDDGADRRPFKLVVESIEGRDIRLANHATPAEPRWNEDTRELTVQLAKAEQVPVELSSYASAADMNLFGTYQWGVTKSIKDLVPGQLKVLVSAEAFSPAVMTPKAFALPLLRRDNLHAATNSLIEVSVLGRNWTVTPHDTLTLVHAVRQPMLPPNLTYRMLARRRAGDTYAVLVDWVQIHGKSTARVVMNAYWKENVDDPADGPPKWGDTAVERKGQAFDLNIGPYDTVALSLREEAPPGLTMPVPPVTTNTDSKAQRHALGDTKHRRIKYGLVASSRFQHYFPPEAETTRTGNTKWLHVPSSARPLAPVVDLVIPAFKWARAESPTSASSTRSGGRLRVYLERPWFSSGDDEKLAVLLWQTGNNSAGYDKLQPYITEWGDDPVYKSKGSLPVSLPKPEHFADWSAKKTYLWAAEHADGEPLYVTAMAYDVQYDSESERWFADIKMSQGNAYFPFVRLALARYQPYSLAGLELSKTVTVDAVQLTPSRSATVSWSAVGDSFTVAVNGRSYEKAASNYGPRMTMSIEKRAADGFAWVPVSVPSIGTGEIEMSTYQPTMRIIGSTSTYWRRTIATRGLDLSGENRIVIREYERHVTGSTVPSQNIGTRPVYVDVLTLAPPPGV